jgi:hypothetical protein
MTASGRTPASNTAGIYLRKVLPQAVFAQEVIASFSRRGGRGTRLAGPRGFAGRQIAPVPLTPALSNLGIVGSDRSDKG